MSIISRITNWTVGQLLKSTDLNGEFNNIVNTINNLDAASTSWDNVKTTNLTATNAAITTLTLSPAFSPTTLGIIGTTTNDSTAAGNVGEYITATTSGTVSSPGSAMYFDLCNISLTAGDWDVTGISNGQVTNASGVTATDFIGAVSFTGGNSNTGLVFGDNEIDGAPPLRGVYDVSRCIAAWRVSIATTTTVYLKAYYVYSGGTTAPLAYGRISARRVR